jgi:hypothetical protein
MQVHGVQLQGRCFLCHKTSPTCWRRSPAQAAVPPARRPRQPPPPRARSRPSARSQRRPRRRRRGAPQAMSSGRAARGSAGLHLFLEWWLGQRRQSRVGRRFAVICFDAGGCSRPSCSHMPHSLSPAQIFSQHGRAWRVSCCTNSLQARPSNPMEQHTVPCWVTALTAAVRSRCSFRGCDSADPQLPLFGWFVVAVQRRGCTCMLRHATAAHAPTSNRGGAHLKVTTSSRRPSSSQSSAAPGWCSWRSSSAADAAVSMGTGSGRQPPTPRKPPDPAKRARRRCFGRWHAVAAVRAAIAVV